MRRWPILLVAATVLPGAVLLYSFRTRAVGEILNGFDLSAADIPAREVKSGGPPRDGIPALMDPPRDPIEIADRWLEDGDRVIGVALGGDAVAYPLRILNWHEVVNDVVGGRPVVVTYCPLCRSGVVFDARIRGERRRFGVSGLLFRSNVLLYDTRTESLFSQLLLRGVSGPLQGEALVSVPFQFTDWGTWREAHPGTQALSLTTGHLKDYGTDPYEGYHRSSMPMFPTRFRRAGHGAKEHAFLVGAPDDPVLVPEMAALEWPDGSMQLEDGTLLTYRQEERWLSAADRAGQSLLVIPGYWFVHRAFYPDAPIIE